MARENYEKSTYGDVGGPIRAGRLPTVSYFSFISCKFKFSVFIATYQNGGMDG